MSLPPLLRLPSLRTLLFLMAFALPACAGDELAIDRASGASIIDVGCTDPGALNYDENATFDDGSCIYYDDLVEALESAGCTDPDAENFDSEATLDDGSCVDTYLQDVADAYIEQHSGCTDENALNYDSAAFFDDGSCEYDEELQELADNYIEQHSGCTDENALNYDPDALFDDGSCEYDPNEPPPGL